MGKVSVRTFDEARPVTSDGGDVRADECADDGVATGALFADARDPIHARLHRIGAGQAVRWAAPATGHLVFVWDGAARIGATRLAAGSMVAIEHGGSAVLHGDPGGATLLVFNRPAGAEPPCGAGGHVHILPAERVPRTERLNERANYGAAIFADSACPTCELWLHESRFHDADHYVVPHYHSEDEIIVVTDGEIVLGRRRYGRGTAIAVARDTVYSFHTGATGLAFINFRPSRPTYATPGEGRVIDEQALYADRLGRPQYLQPA